MYCSEGMSLISCLIGADQFSITPKIDPAVGGADVANALSAQTVLKPLQADGKSIADLLSENGFTNFTTSGASASPAQSSGKVNAKSAGDGPAAAPGNETAPPPPASMSVAPTAVSPPIAASGSMVPPPPPAPPSPPAMSAPPPPPLASPPGSPANAVGNVSADASVVAPPAPPACTCTCGAMAANAANANSTAAAAGAAKKHHKGKQGGAAAKDGISATNNVTASAGNDFGSCDPTISFKAGRPGRKGQLRSL